MSNLILDFQGDITLEVVRGFLRNDDSKEARALLQKLVAENGVEDMLVTLADCLRENLKTGISEESIHEQLTTYSDSLGERCRWARSPWPQPCLLLQHATGGIQRSTQQGLHFR
ncbi:MAG: hypothetical protein U0165_13415 [Polyangiaceae bacterium]